MNKILIIEDEEAIADLEKDYLELSGFQVEIEHEGDKGLERAMTSEYDLIILDLMLPGMDGFEICRRIRDEKTYRFSWYPQRRTISIKSGAWVWEPMTI